MKHYKIQDYKEDIENYSNTVRITDFEHFFNVYDDNKRSCETFNLNATLYLNADKSAMLSSMVQHDTFWPQLSYSIYSTPRLAWMLMKLNNVKAEDMFKPVPTGSTIYYIDQDTMQDIIQQIN